VAVHSRGELALAPDEYAGFVMACLRMLALNGEAGPAVPLTAPGAPAAAPPPDAAHMAAPSVAAPSIPASGQSASGQSASGQASPGPASPRRESAPAPAEAAPIEASPSGDGPPPWEDAPDDIPPEAETYVHDPDEAFETLAPAASPQPGLAAAPRAGAGGAATPCPRLADISASNWPELAARLPLTGLAGELARQSEWAGLNDGAVVLRVPVRTLALNDSRVRLQTVLCEHFGQGLRLDIQVGATGEATAHAAAVSARAARQRAAEDEAARDPFVQALVDGFGARVVPGSVRPLDPPAA
jgi:DNA polymerase-3 subunit gamma/tau